MATSDSDANPPGAVFPRLPGGPGQMPPEQVARHQTARLEGAMVETVARHGYAGVTLRELVSLAGVSKSTFYEHFENKQDCFLATMDEIVAQLGARVEEAYRSGGDFRERLVAGLAAFVDLAVDEPAAATLVAVESLSLGAAGVAHRERASRSFELLIQQSFDHSPSERRVSERTVRAIVTGIRGVVYRHLRDDRAEELPERVEELVDWALRYQRDEGEAVRRAAAAASVAAAVPPKPAPSLRVGTPPGWDEPPDSPLSRMSLSQRDRIVRGAARVVVANGYHGLSIPAISTAAGVSNQTFYEQFANKRDAFLGAFEILATEAFGSTVAAYAKAGDRPEAIGVSLRAMLEHIADNELFARLAFFELPTAGPEALDRADAILDSFTLFLSPERAPSGVAGVDSKPIRDAIASGIWGLIQHEIAQGRRRELPALAPEIARIALTPACD